MSNRLPVTLTRGARGLERKRSAGGLVSAMEPVLRKRGGTWVGWPGTRLRDDETLEDPDDLDELYRLQPVRLSDGEVTRYYHGLSNRTLWPLLHSFPERTRFDPRNWDTYEAVNERFADVTAAEAGDADLIWVHDYHLTRVPLFLRRRLPDARIAFFLHIPFPPVDVFRLLPWARHLLRGLLGADLVGFHTDGYVRNFLDCVDRLLGARVDASAALVEHGERTVRVGAFPLGIEFDRYEALARSAPRSSTAAERVILGVDRLDYTKGIPQRILAFERLLERFPEHREKVVLLQLAVPSRYQVAEYQALKREIDELIGRVNGRFATADWSPIRYLYRSVSTERLVALYRDAEIGLVTPVRDGMNLVAKEFTACRVDEPGVLVLSRLAGAAETMAEAILVNPYHVEGTAEALHRALTMDPVERRSRMLALRRRERRRNVDDWLERFLVAAHDEIPRLPPPSGAEFQRWLGDFLRRFRLALFVDFDGTLAPIASHPSRAKLSRAMRRALLGAAARKDVDVTIVSGRSAADLAKLIRNPDVAIAGNHGFEIRGGGLEPFEHEALASFREQVQSLAAKLEPLLEDGAWVEEKGATLTVHYREAAHAAHERIAQASRECIERTGFRARPALCAVEARPPVAWDKGAAVLHVLRQRYGEAWSEGVRAIYVGDDDTDEDAFRVLDGLGISFRVGGADVSSSATRLLPDTEAVRGLLEWIAHPTS